MGKTHLFPSLSLLLFLAIQLTQIQSCGMYASCDVRCDGYCTSANATTNNDCCHGCKSVQVNVTGLGPKSYFWWANQLTCSDSCEVGYYDQVTPGTACLPCHIWCLTCKGGNSSQDCTACNTSAYQKNSTSCYNYMASDHSYNVNNPCPDGYYGLQITKVCVPCPTGCSQCAIYLTWQMPSNDFATSYNQYNVSCTNDSLCGYTLKCYGCVGGYTLINGWCILNTVCLTYSKLNSAGGAFSTANCLCFPNYKLLALSICQKCDISCLTCSGLASNNCVTCPTGANATSGVCTYNGTYSVIQNKVTGLGVGWTNNVTSPAAGIDFGLCTGYVFGYYGYNLIGKSYHDGSKTDGISLFPSRATLTYTKTGLGLDHYGIHFRATLLFIDQWTNGMTILFQEGGYNRFSFTYQMGGITGEYLCGLNYHDHIDVVDDWYQHTSSSTILKIFATTDGFAWGIKQITMHIMKCHQNCTTCTGPLSSDCVACTTNRIVVNGICQCDSANNWFQITSTGVCTQNCLTMYRNTYIYQCVSDCSFPYSFKYNNNGVLQCVISCPVGYKYYVNYTCISVCYDSAITNVSINYYKFDGADKACYQTCPSGTFGDKTTGSCVKNCPAYNSSTEDGYFSYNSFCYESCPSSSTAFIPQRACLSSCPSGYYKNSVIKGTTTSFVCQQQCTVTLSGISKYGDNATGLCTNYCSVGTYGDISNNKCTSYCNATSFGQSLVNNGTTQRLCVQNCSVSNNLYGNPFTGICVTPVNCPTNYYADALTSNCTTFCSNQAYFGQNSTHQCLINTTACNNSGFRQKDVRLCVKTCTNKNTSAVPLFGDPLTGYCIATCTGAYFADIQHNRECVLTCTDYPQSTFGLSYECVTNCSNTTWADQYDPNRICTTSCTNNPTNQSYGLNDTRTCVLNCPDYQFAQNVSGIPLCTVDCLSPLFGDIIDNRCKNKCPDPYYGDLTGNRTCLKKCPWPYFGQNCTLVGSVPTISDVRECKLICTCGWADNSSQLCAWNSNGCANFTFAHESNHKCVDSMDCTGFGDPITRNCITTCSSNTSIRYFGDASTKKCVLICPQNPNYFGDNLTHKCETTCTNSQIRDIQNIRRCVALNNCSRTPLVLFGDATKALCVTAFNCSDGFWADNNTITCNPICTSYPKLYADNVTKQCVSVCQFGWYALNITHNATTIKGICSQHCPTDQWADNITAQCTKRCSNNTYGVNYTAVNWSAYSSNYTVQGTCQQKCPVGQYARDSDNLCVSDCQAGLWGDTVTRTCKTDPKNCSQGYYADDFTHKCVLPIDCSFNGTLQFYADNSSRKCLSKCPSTILNYADTAKKLCVAECPTGFYGINSSLLCNQTCLGDNSYADPQLHICVANCSATPIPTFGQNTTSTCVQAKYCPNWPGSTDPTWAEQVINHRRCIKYCPTQNQFQNNSRMYADNLTRTCVTKCPPYSYADFSNNWGMCVYICPNLTNTTLQFADNYTQLCVTVCPAANATWGDNSTRSCVSTCPSGSYAQEVPNRYCVDKCKPTTWGEDIKRTCVTDPHSCPTVNGSLYYAQDFTAMCVKICPINTTGIPDDYWGQNTTRKCKTSCVDASGAQSGFKWFKTRICIDECPGQLDRDGYYSDQGACYLQCITANYYRDPQYNRSCQNNCTFSPYKQYADDTTWRCVPKCPTFNQTYYAYDTDKKCVSTCPNSYRKYQALKICVATCPNGTFFNPDTYQCLSECPRTTSTNQTLYGDTNLTEPKCVINSSCSLNFYADDVVGLCVDNCTEGQIIYLKNCVASCPDGYYDNGIKIDNYCVLPANCPNNTYADNVTGKCVQICVGSFADNNSRTCVFVCPIINGTKYYADSYTRICATTCTNNDTIKLIENDANRTCVSICNPNLFLEPITNNCSPNCSNHTYADNSTRVCVTVCPSSPQLFGQNGTYTCVQDCLQSDEFKLIQDRVCVTACPGGYFRQNISRSCVTDCPNTTYANQNMSYCVYNCSPLYAYDQTSTCQSLCPSPYFRDPTTFKCVFFCPTYPSSYFQVVNGTDRLCDTVCPTDQFRDYTTYMCVASCPISPITFADKTIGSCISVCSNGSFGYLPTRTCETTCPDNLFADHLTRRCVSKCDPLLGYYGDAALTIPACVKICSNTSYADAYTQTCVGSCRKTPKMYRFDNLNASNPIRICVYSCPYPYVSDNMTDKCILNCSSSTLPYADQAAQSCVSKCTSPVYQYSYLQSGTTINGNCVKFCPNGTFAYLKNNSCVSKCPNGSYGSTMNNTCYDSCNLADGYYADPLNNMCVSTCFSNSTYVSFADEYTRTCVTSCPSDKLTVGDKTNWKCVERCSNLSQFADPVTGHCESICSDGYFADNSTQLCVSNCSLYSLKYGNTATKVCVDLCQNTTLYADDLTRLCVNSTSCPPGYFGLNATKVCVAICPSSTDLYGDIYTKTCQTACSNVTFADPSTRTCVDRCPAIPSLFGRTDTMRCVLQCPNGKYADNYTALCVSIGSCSSLPVQTYADNTTNQCVAVCPSFPQYYASNYTWQCVFYCPALPIPLFADNLTRTCVQFCPNGTSFTFADNLTRRCVDICPGNTYNQNSTKSCETQCLTGFADPQSKYCVAICPNYTYGDINSKTCMTVCPNISGIQWYGQDANNLCMTDCLASYNTYRDPYTKRCVRICPISQGYFAENTSRLCVANCPGTFQIPVSFADNSTRFCVPTCPRVPSLFAILATQICTEQCPNTTWAQNNSRICVSSCNNTVPQTFGDNSTWTCVIRCPTKPNTYADNSTYTCVSVCPDNPDYYADNITGRCVKYCPNFTFADPTTRTCVTTCPLLYYGVNSTRRCVTQCPWKSFADNLTHLCLAKCSVDPIFYGNPDTLRCVGQCPAGNNSFGNPLTQECVNYQSNGTSGCNVTYFADNLTRICRQVCPMDNDTYGDNSTWKCVSVCPAGTQNTFADNSTMRCVKICPFYPDFYADPFSRRCRHFCLKPNSTFTGSFSDNSTRKCVQQCPSNPDYYSDNSTLRCVLYCPRYPLTFADNQTRRCVSVCPSVPDIYGDLKTLRCVPQCPHDQDTYAQPNSRLCVVTCPANYSLFANNYTRRCETTCPNGTYADPSSRRCVFVCPRYPQLYADPSTNRCVVTCPPSPSLFADPNTQMCISRCPTDFYAQNNTRRCLPECLYNVTNYADNLTNKCVFRCPANQSTYGDNSTQRCVTHCPIDQFTYADNITQMCISICNNVSNGGFADNYTRVCVLICPNYSYADITTRYCVRYCPPGWFAYAGNNTCVNFCPTPYFADNSTWKCVDKCPVGQSLFGSKHNNTCVFNCLQGTYASLQSQQCVVRCPNRSQTLLGYDTFGYNDTNFCVDQCPVPLYGYPVAQVCVDICPDPYYQNYTDHLCYACPAECASCNHPLVCLTCIANHFLYSGACMQSCPTFPIITYANPNRVCGTASQCTQGYYALNSTKSCVQNCPPGFFVNIPAQSCDSCMKGCVRCTQGSICLNCNTNISVWSNYKCYIFCSALKRFYYTTGCIASCPAGTYLNLTTCQPCNIACTTCVISSQNCLICSNGYYRANGICVSKCPDRTIAQVVNGTQTCVSCDVANCQVEPLTFTTTQFVDNFKYNVQIQFSQPVNIMDEIDKVIRIQQKTSNRLLVQTMQYLDYTIIDYGNGLYSFVLNNYNPSSNTQIQVQIINPAAIIGSNGQIPQTTRASLMVDSSNIFSLDSYKEGIASFIKVAVILSFILLVLTFWTDHSIWMPMYDFMQMMMVLIFVNITFPPDLLYSINGLFGAAFNFLPNFFTNYFKQATYNQKLINNNIYSLMQDGSFLRVMGPLYFILLVLGCILLGILIISKRFFNKQIKKWAKTFIKETFWKKHLHGLVYILFLPVFAFAIFDMRIYSYLGKSSIQIFSILSSWVFMILFLIVLAYFGYRLRKIIKDSPLTYLMIQKAYNFITYQKTVLIQNKSHYFTNDKNQVDLTNAREPRINELLVFPYPIETKTGPWDITFPLFSYLHKFLMALFLGISFANPVIQLCLLVIVNLTLIVYIIVRRPLYKVRNRQFNNQIYIHNLIIGCLIYVILLIFTFLYTQLSMVTKVLIGDMICGLFIQGLLVNFIYFLFRSYNYYHHNYWKAFVRSDIFRINYTVQYLGWTAEYDKEQAKLMSEVKSRGQFLEAIKVETGQALANMVAARQPSVSTNTKNKMKSLQLRPNRSEEVSKQFGRIFTNMANQKERSHQSIASSQRLSKGERKKVRDTIFGQKQIHQDRAQEYHKLQLIDEKSQVQHAHSVNDSNIHDDQTEYQYEYVEEQYPEGTPMEEILQGCKKGDVILPL